MTGPVRLADVLNTVFGAGATTAAEARAWLRAGGWQRVDDWLASGNPVTPKDTGSVTREDEQHDD